MSVSDLKKWMERNEMTPIDIAAALKIHPNTVNNFLKGKRVHRSTRAALERLVHQHKSSMEQKTSA